MRTHHCYFLSCAYTSFLGKIKDSLLNVDKKMRGNTLKLAGYAPGSLAAVGLAAVSALTLVK